MSNSSDIIPIRLRQNFIQQILIGCKENPHFANNHMKNYFTSYINIISPLYKKNRDPLTMKTITSKCPSCSEKYSSTSYKYTCKMRANTRIKRLLQKYRRTRLTPLTYKRLLLDSFYCRSHTKLSVTCTSCNEIRRFNGATREDLEKKKLKQQYTSISLDASNKKQKIVDNKKTNEKLKQTFQNASCRFLKRESNLRAFLEQL
ncbi:unnamed protein product [Didymodactylos carnosus]|uniref:Uncharacterized protein n=1 Tax=Didymodactylos carnosus TaxID=1234261 RepID=A0A813XMQ5_9BILA|nr:unnamed protein product [Didymodactylos carnosus]CAF0880604.1 unnamed protein product [Didymodactylos carnosus]CAF3657686.1 unnamed protein product [Didymodactylos carnosus]CAF3664316.1 unnamed protein product [Didymodactylos carnosus]